MEENKQTNRNFPINQISNICENTFENYLENNNKKYLYTISENDFKSSEIKSVYSKTINNSNAINNTFDLKSNNSLNENDSVYLKKNIDKSIILTKSRIKNYKSNEKNSEIQNLKKNDKNNSNYEM